MTTYEEFLVNQEIKKFQQELNVYKDALELACWLLSKANGCFNGYCPLEKTISDNGGKTPKCPDCDNYTVFQEYFLQKAREEEE